MTEALPRGAGLSSPRDQVDYDPGNQDFGQPATSSVQSGTTSSHKQGESRSIEEASSFPGLNEDSTEQNWPETLSEPTSSEDGHQLSISKHGKDLLSEEIRASIESLEERVKQLEDGKVQPPGLKVDLDVPKDQVPSANIRPPTRIIPQMKYVGWHGFKNKLANQEEAYAIEVLVGEAKLYHQRAEEEKKDEVKGDIHGHDQRARLPMKLGDEAYAPEPSTSKEVRERIRINSIVLLKILQEIGLNLGNDPLVFLRPYKCLVYYDAQLREKYHRLEARWGACESGIALSHGGPGIAKAADQDHDEAETNKPLDPPLTAKEEESTQNQILESSIAQRESTFGQDLGLSSKVPAEVEIDHSLEDCPVENTSHSTVEVGNSNPNDKSVLDEDSQKGIDSKDLTDSVEAFRNLRCLIEFIDSELKPVVEGFKARRRKKVYFSDLWYLFRPGDLLYTPLDNKADTDVARSLDNDLVSTRKVGARFQEVWRIDATGNGRPNLRAPADGEPSTKMVNPFVIQGYHVDLIYMHTYDTYMYEFKIDAFPGQRDIFSLPFYPLEYVADADRLCSKWKTRGEAFREFHTFVHKYYIGRSLTSHPNGDCPPNDNLPKHAENIDSQVVIDFSEAFAANPGWQVYGDEDPQIRVAAREFEESYPTNFWSDSNRKVLHKPNFDYIYQDSSIDLKLSDEQRLNDKLMGNKREVILSEHGELSDEHLMLLPNRVFAFVLRNRKFALLTVDGLRPIKPYVDGFNDLKLPKGHKAMVKSLVHNHFMTKGADAGDRDDDCENDVVRGKGKGLILLLHGAPGVGKTSTAECVAEANGKMLFPITCGDLGTTAADVERELSDKFHLAELWDCVLLLDEADVFLAQRTKYDVSRNSLVSVFLRVLEYFTGILFLTTNRVGAFDEAFKSRIHVSLYYPPLNWERTEAIWRMHMRRSVDKKNRKGVNLHIDEAEILAFAKKHYFLTTPKKANWNGRQIRNAFQTATALAEYEAHDHRSDRTKATLSEQAKPRELELKVDHFDKVAWASFEFDSYLSQTRAFTDTELAFQNAERTDHFRSSEGSFSRREQPQVQSFAPSATVPTPRSDPRPWTKTQQQQQRAPRPTQAPVPLSYAQNIPMRMEASHITTQNIPLNPGPGTGYDSSWPEATPWPAESMMSQVDRPEEQELFAPQLAARRQAMGDTGPMGNTSMYGYGDDDEGY